jgi:hypothetical protein
VIRLRVHVSYVPTRHPHGRTAPEIRLLKPGVQLRIVLAFARTLWGVKDVKDVIGVNKTPGRVQSSGQ